MTRRDLVALGKTVIETMLKLKSGYHFKHDVWVIEVGSAFVLRHNPRKVMTTRIIGTGSQIAILPNMVCLKMSMNGLASVEHSAYSSIDEAEMMCDMQAKTDGTCKVIVDYHTMPQCSFTAVPSAQLKHYWKCANEQLIAWCKDNEPEALEEVEDEEAA